MSAGSRAEHDGRSSACVTRHNDWGWVWQLNSRVTGPTVHIQLFPRRLELRQTTQPLPGGRGGCGALPARTVRQSAQGRRRVGTRRTARYVQSWSIPRPPVSSCLDRRRAVWRQHVNTLQSSIPTLVGQGTLLLGLHAVLQPALLAAGGVEVVGVEPASEPLP